MTSNLGDHSTTDDPLHAEAASWFVRIHTREPSIEEVADWQRWLMADDAHRQAFSRFEDLWQTIGKSDLHLHARNCPDAGGPVAAPTRAVRQRWGLASAAAVLVVAIGTMFLWSGTPHLSQLSRSAVVETRTAEYRTYSLADGSRIDIGARTRVVVDFSHSTRSIIIDSGEAYFEVAHDTRPFVVHAGSGMITALGTVFNVNHVEGRVAVAVVEGMVDVREFADNRMSSPATVSEAPQSGSRGPLLVRAGEGVVYGRTTRSVEAVDTHVATAWREGYLKFIREPLGYVAADVERYTSVQISIADPAVAELLYTGTVIPDKIDDWLALLSHAFPIEVQRISKRTVLLKPRAERSEASETTQQ